MAFVAIDAAEGVLAAVAEASNGDIIGITRYERVRPQVAEVATVVADRWQGRGLGLILLYHLAIYGRRRGYATFIGTMSSRNRRAIRSLMDCGLPYTLKKMGEDTLLASLDITQLDCLAVVHSE
jgi:GNAT superfamily N-acetyltransferase